jgi:YfiH family protein
MTIAETSATLITLSSPLLSRLPGVRHGFFTRRGGVSTGLYASLNAGRGSKDDPEAVVENRRRVAAHFGAQPEALLTAYQIHSATALAADGPWGDARPQGDAVVTSTPGLICSALAADCAPILLADAQAGVVAAAHAGWKGALGGVAEATVAAMIEQGAVASRLVAAVGPCIGPKSYEVGEDFLSAFMAKAPEAAAFFRPGAAADKRLFDLPGFVLDRLARAGVAEAEWIGGDTYGDEALFFSNRRAFHRSEGDYGRLISGIMLG